METSLRMASLLGALDLNDFRPRPSDTTRSTIDAALGKGWVEGHKTRPALRLPDQYRLTPEGEKAINFYLK
jgi:hypothetical protein